MRWLTLILILLATCSCGEELMCLHGHYTDNYGVCVISNEHSISLQEVEVVIDLAKKRIIEQDSDLTEAQLNGVFEEYYVSVEFVPNHYKIMHEGEECTGICHYDNIKNEFNIYVRYDDCLGYTSLGHEILHMFLIHAKNDYSHQLPWFEHYVKWSYELLRHTVEFNIDRDFKCQYCKQDG